MAYPINSNDVFQVTIRGFMFGQLVMTTLHYRYAPGSPVITNGSTALDDIFGQLDLGGDVLDDLSTILPPQLGSIEVDLQWVYPLRYRRQTYLPSNTAGLGTATTVGNVDAVMTLFGETATRRSIANKHLPCSPDDCDQGLMTAAYKLAATAYVAQVQADLNPGAGLRFYEPIIWGRPQVAFTKCGVDHPALPALRTDVAGAFIQDTSRVMRRRTVGAGK